MTISPLPLRQIHLDFHTGPDIKNVGSDFNAEEFALTLKNANVNSINLFAKCHHGLNYYPTKVGVRHPHLRPGLDLLGEQIEACHRHGIRCPIYISIGWEASAAQRHPEWRQVGVDGKLVGAPTIEQGRPWGWPWLCVNNTYADELAAQTEELLNMYEVDGFWFDIMTYDKAACLCENCLRDMRNDRLNPALVEDRLKQVNNVSRRFMSRIGNLVKKSKYPDAEVFFNGRTGFCLENEPDLHSVIEIESLPTGGWGYGFYPLWSRYGRNFGKPTVGMTGRFHKGWADWGGLKHPDALRFECAGILATGGAVSIGDQMHPSAKLNKAVYSVISAGLAEVKAVEEFCIGAVAQTQVGLLVLDRVDEHAELGSSGGSFEGAGKMLLEHHHQFDFITPATCSDFSRYEMLIIPDKGSISAPIVSKLKSFIANGGKLMLSHEALLDKTTGTFALGDEMGVDFVGMAPSNPDFFEVVDPRLTSEVVHPGFCYGMYDGPSTRITARPGTQTLAQVHETYFNRTWEHYSSHWITPPLAESGSPAITLRANVMYLYSHMFGMYLRHGNLSFRGLLGRCWDLLLPNRLLSTNAPHSTEVTIMRQGERQMVHIVNYTPSRRSSFHVEPMEKPIPLHDITIDLRRSEPTRRVFLAKSKQALPFTIHDGVVSITVPKISTSEIVVFEG